MTITDAVIVAGIAAVPPTIIGVSTLLATIRSKAKIDVTEQKIDQTGKKLEVVHELVNSRLTAALDKIDRLEAKLQLLTGRTPTGEPPPIQGLNKPTDLIPRKQE